MTVNNSLSYSYRVSQPHTYKRDGKLVAEGYDPNTCKHWYRIDFGRINAFYSLAERDKALDVEFNPEPVPGQLLLPARVPLSPRARRLELLKLKAEHGTTIPSNGVICIPPTEVNPEQAPGLDIMIRPADDSYTFYENGVKPIPAYRPEPFAYTKAQTFQRNKLLDEVQGWMETISALDNSPYRAGSRDWVDILWQHNCRKDTAFSAIYSFGVMVNSGV